MKFVLSLLFTVTLFVAGSMFINDVVFSSILSLIGVSLLSFWAGSGLKGSLYGTSGQRIAGFVLAAIFMFIANWLTHAYPFVVRIFDVTLGGGLWAALYFVVAFFATKRVDAVTE